MGRDAFDLGETFLAGLFQERMEGGSLEPRRLLRQEGNGRQFLRQLGRCEVAQDARFPEGWFLAVGHFDGKQPFVDDLSETVHDAGTVEIESRWLVMLDRVEARPCAEGVHGQQRGVTADGLEEWMPRRDPFQSVFLRHVAVGG